MLDTIEQNTAPYCIDAMAFGNVSRFINHSCNPNLENYQIFVDDLNPHKPRIAFFAKRDIKKGEEISFDYRYPVASTGVIRCLCGADNCRGYLC